MLASASLGATPVPQQGQVEGEVLQVFPGVIVIKNEESSPIPTEYRPYN